MTSVAYALGGGDVLARLVFVNASQQRDTLAAIALIVRLDWSSRQTAHVLHVYLLALEPLSGPP